MDSEISWDGLSMTLLYEFAGSVLEAAKIEKAKDVTIFSTLHFENSAPLSSDLPFPQAKRAKRNIRESRLRVLW